MFCSSCGTRNPEDANFCMKCGKAFRDGSLPTSGQRQLRWEYKDVIIPLNLIYQDVDTGDAPEFVETFNRIVLGHLQRAGQEGWQADGPTDWGSSGMVGRTETHEEKAGFLGLSAVLVYDSVTFRLKRLVR